MGGLYLGDKLVTPVVVEKEEVAKTKFGVSIDNFLGDVGENGNYVSGSVPFTFDASSIYEDSGYIRTLPDGSVIKKTTNLDYIFYSNLFLSGTIDLSNLTTYSGLGSYHLERSFYNTAIEKVITPKALSNSYAAVQFNETFSYCQCLKEVIFSDPYIGGQGHVRFYNSLQNCAFADAAINVGDIETIDSYGFYGTFRYSELPEEMRFTKLTQIIGTSPMAYCFAACTGGKRFYFPALTSVGSGPFGTSKTTAAWASNTDVEEIHFRADMQATIEATTQYANKWGATSSTIYFDL